MRGAATLIAYLLALGAIISFGIASLMALQSPTKPMPSEPVAAVAPHKERAAKPIKKTTQKDAQSNQKRKTENATRKGFDAYGFADEPHRVYQLNPFRFFGR